MKHTKDKVYRGGNAAIFVNPGAGEMKSGNEKEAIKNVERFLVDIGGGDFKRVPKQDNYGRFAFLIKGKEVLMPGIPLKNVRYMGKPQDIWDFPRLFVDGNSWVWKYALSAFEEDN